MPLPIEATYPLSFRQQDAQALGDHLKQHNSVTLIGMKRVGISNFLRFFLYHPKVVSTYVHNGNPLFIPIDLNDLVTRQLPAFWTLTLKRLVDALSTTESEQIFTKSIQLQDTFFTIDSIKRMLTLITKQKRYPVLFFIRFDRLADIFTPEAFANLQGVKDAANQKHSFVFTSHRPLHELAPKVFKRSSMSVFAHDMYLKPALPQDMHIILHTFEDRYDLKLPQKLADQLIELTGGHVQYLQLALIKLRQETSLPSSEKKLLEVIRSDEEITLQSEELFSGLTKPEQATLKTIPPTPQDSYLWHTGMITPGNKIFSPLFARYLKNQQAATGSTDFTKKEHALFTYLKENIEKLCERDDIISAVWPEQEELGVSDWAIDRLVARVRAKLKSQSSPYKIETIVTRGYKLVG